MRKDQKRLKNNNKGFTLLEVLVSMIVFTVVAVPLLRAFATSAQTNAKAKLQMKSTTAAENIMERIKSMDKDELDSFEATYTTGSGTERHREFILTNSSTSSDLNDEMKADLPDGFYATVELDADGTGPVDYAYPNANSLNLADYNPISVRDCAIYTMPESYDSDAYDVFVTRNTEARSAAVAAGRIPPPLKDKTYFKENLKRSIDIIVRSGGPDYVDPEGITHILTKVQLKITYTCPSGIVDNNKYVATDLYLFDNSASHKDLNGIYLFYYPRYSAASNGKEYIDVVNNTSVKTNLYIVGMNGAEDQSEFTANKYLTFGNCLNLTITDKDAVDADGRGNLSLRTNLLKVNTTTTTKTPYSSADTTTGYGIGFKLKYQNGSPVVTYNADQNTDPNNDMHNQAIIALNLSDVDGKTLNNNTDTIRIYRLRVKVYDDDGNVLSSMEGTKLKQ